MNKKVLILSASTGGGHNRAAQAIKEELAEKDIACEIVDSLKFISPTMDKLISKGYEKSAMYTPNAYGQIYKISDLKISKKELNVNLIFKYMTRKIKKLISIHNPDAIIGTHPFPLMSASRLKEKNIINIPIISVLTDYTIHSTWIQKEIDSYIVGDEFVKQLLIQEGICEDSIHPFGIPVEKSFANAVTPKEQILEDFNLEDKFTVLLMGGSFGAGDIKSSLKELLSIDRDFQIIVVTGRNASLKEKLEKFLETHEYNKNVSMLAFTQRMSDLLSISNILITKPGGLTTTESFLKEIPMIIPYFIPGQEEENLDFLLNSGVAIKTTEKFTLTIILKLLIDNPQRLEQLKENIRTIQKTNSSEKIADLILSKIN